MSSRTYSCTTIGLNSTIVEVEADNLRSAQFGFAIVGLPDVAISEARERVRSAIKNSGFRFPRGKTIVNLAPADIKKQGPVFDLPIAISLLLHSDQLDFDCSDKLFIGELALDGSLRPVSGVLPIILTAIDKGFKEVFVPQNNALEAAMVQRIKVLAAKDLASIVCHLKGDNLLKPFKSPKVNTVNTGPEEQLDFKNIKGQDSAKWALEVAAAGDHNILMSGPPGSGKTLLARSLPSILPNMTLEESLEATKIHSVAGVLTGSAPLVTIRPFRSPHHTSSGAALVGGGAWPRPGEISLAHRGVLFLDEFPEFSRSVLENLRQPLEDGMITISRAQGSLTFPAKFTLVAAMNPCPCGYANDPEQECQCSPATIYRYNRKISGPILDRIDMHIEVARVEYDKLVSVSEDAKSSQEIKKAVQVARDRQTFRFRNFDISCNSEMKPNLIKQFCQLPNEATSFLRQTAKKIYLSARSYHRILKLARTLADLDGSDKIRFNHISEAIQFRPRLDVES